MAVPGPLPEYNLPSDSNLEAAWNEWFELVIDMVDEVHVTGCGLLGFVGLRVTGYKLRVIKFKGQGKWFKESCESCELCVKEIKTLRVAS